MQRSSFLGGGQIHHDRRNTCATGRGGVWIITISICRLTTNVAYTDVVMSNPPQNAKVFEPVECSMTKMGFDDFVSRREDAPKV